MEAPATRRVVTGLNAEGRSHFVVDGPMVYLADTASLAWRTASMPADNSQPGDCEGGKFSFEEIYRGGSAFMLVTYAPGKGQGRWHTTDTIDYIVMLEGELVLVVETGETVLRPGDFIIDRGVSHAWRNDTDKPARAMVVMLPADPVGSGKTV